MTELELDKEAWMKAFRSLPEEPREMLETWFSTQALIIRHLCIAENEWFELIGWALHHPNDFSFIDAFPASAPGADAVESRESGDREARKAIGGTVEKNVATGPGLAQKASGESLDRELYRQFMANKMNETPRGRPVPRRRGRT